MDRQSVTDGQQQEDRDMQGQRHAGTETCRDRTEGKGKRDKDSDSDRV